VQGRITSGLTKAANDVDRAKKGGTTGKKKCGKKVLVLSVGRGRKKAREKEAPAMSKARGGRGVEKFKSQKGGKHLKGSGG